MFQVCKSVNKEVPISGAVFNFVYSLHKFALQNVIFKKAF